MKYIVNVSGGLTSFEALRRTIERHGKENTHAVFADTLIEDEDLYRFLLDQAKYFDIEIKRLVDGRTPFQVMRDKRCFTMQSMAPCSKFLKRETIDRHIEATYEPGNYTLVFGMDWTEMHRVERLRASSKVPVWFPLCEKPYVDKCQIAASLKEIGIAVPRLYDLGFTHNNCGGGCVRAGQAHFANLYRKLPDRFAIWEDEERKIQEFLGKQVTILTEQIDGQVQPLSLQAFRERLESGGKYDKDDWRGCGCFAPIAQMRMEDLLLAAQ